MPGGCITPIINAATLPCESQNSQTCLLSIVVNKQPSDALNYAEDFRKCSKKHYKWTFCVDDVCSVSLSMCVYVYMSVCLSVCLSSRCPSEFVSVICGSACVCVCEPVCLCLYRFMRVSVWSHDCSAVRLLPDKSRPPLPVYVNTSPSSYISSVRLWQTDSQSLP